MCRDRRGRLVSNVEIIFKDQEMRSNAKGSRTVYDIRASTRNENRKGIGELSERTLVLKGVDTWKTAAKNSKSIFGLSRSDAAAIECQKPRVAVSQ